jgi:hypothetical protein
LGGIIGSRGSSSTDVVMEDGVSGMLPGEEVLDVELPDFEEDIVEISPSEPLGETVHEFDGPAASVANSTAATLFVSLKLARSRLPHL